MRIKIAAVIVTYNRKELLLEALNSLVHQTYKLEKIIVIDNASNDGTHKYLLEHGMLNLDIIQYMRLNENIGGSGGFHRGIYDALKQDVDWIALSDDDAIYERDFFSIIAKNIYEHKDIKAFTGTVVTENKIDITHRRRIINNVNLSQKEISEEEYSKEFLYLDVFSFVGCVISKEVIHLIGLPEKDYFIWLDDTEYSLRVRDKTRILNINKAIIYHKTKIARDNLMYEPTWKEFYGFRNQSFMLLKHSRSKFIAFIYIILKNIKAICFTVLAKKYKNYRIYRIKVIIDSLSAFLLNKKGKNMKYLPNN